MVFTFIIYYIIFLPSLLQCQTKCETVWLDLFCYGMKSKGVSCDLVYTIKLLLNLSFSSFLDSAVQMDEGWHSMAQGLFITDEVAVGVVASVWQSPSAHNTLTVSLAQVVGTALPYDKHSLVEGSWTSARQAAMNRATTR